MNNYFHIVIFMLKNKNNFVIANFVALLQNFNLFVAQFAHVDYRQKQNILIYFQYYNKNYYNSMFLTFCIKVLNSSSVI